MPRVAQSSASAEVWPCGKFGLQGDWGLILEKASSRLRAQSWQHDPCWREFPRADKILELQDGRIHAEHRSHWPGLWDAESHRVLHTIRPFYLAGGNGSVLSAVTVVRGQDHGKGRLKSGRNLENNFALRRLLDRRWSAGAAAAALQVVCSLLRVRASTATPRRNFAPVTLWSSATRGDSWTPPRCSRRSTSR